MKWIYFPLIALLGSGFLSCDQNSSASGTNDTTENKIIPPASDNSQATNPSLADTAYPDKDKAKRREDSSRAIK